MFHTNFREHLNQASSELRLLSQVIENIEKNLIKYDEARSVDVLTGIVRGMNKANELAQSVKFGRLPFIKDEDKSVGEAIELTVDELVRRYNSARDDLEVITKTRKKPVNEKPKYLNTRVGPRFNPA